VSPNTDKNPNERLFFLTKDVKVYRENFHRINLKIIGCLKCRSLNVICYGTYFRKKAGVRIRRIYCKDCGACLGWLPPFLLAKKHYPISRVLPIIKKYLMGSVGYYISWCKANINEPEYSTFLRWIKVFSGMAEILYKTACKTLAAFKPDWKFEKDKRLFTACFPAAGNQKLKLLYRTFILQEYFSFESAGHEDFFAWLIFQHRYTHRSCRYQSRL